MACCFEVSAGRVGRHTLFRGNTAFRRQKLSNQSKEALQTTKKSLEDELKKVMVKAEKNSRTCFLEEFIQKNRAQGLFAFLLRDHLRDVTIVLAWKLKEEERLERALFGPEFVGQKQIIFITAF